MKKLILFLLFFIGIIHDTSLPAARARPKRRIEFEYSTNIPLAILCRRDDHNSEELLNFVTKNKEHYAKEVAINQNILFDFVLTGNLAMLTLFLNEHNVNKSGTIGDFQDETLINFAISQLSPKVTEIVTLLLKIGANANLIARKSAKNPLYILREKEVYARKFSGNDLNESLRLIREIVTILCDYGVNDIAEDHINTTINEAQREWHNFKANAIKVMLEIPALKAFPPGLLTAHDERRPLLDEYLFK